MYIEGGRTPSGFFTVEETEIIHRMYRLHELPNLQRQLYLETVPIDVKSLDSKFAFVLDAGYIIYVWNGKKAKNTMKQKGLYFFLFLSICYLLSLFLYHLLIFSF